MCTIDNSQLHASLVTDIYEYDITSVCMIDYFLGFSISVGLCPDYSAICLLLMILLTSGHI